MSGHRHHRPAIVGDQVIIADRHSVAAVALADGAERWRQTFAGDCDASPLIADGLVILPVRDGRVHAFAVSDGTPRWLVDAPAGAAGDYFSAARAGSRALYADWSHAVEARTLATGALAWRIALPGVGANAPVVVGEDAYVTGRANPDDESLGFVAAIDAARGMLRWRVTLPGGVLGGPAVCGDLFVVTTKVAVIGLAADGSQRWRVARRRFAYEHIVVDAAGRILLGGDDDAVLVIDGATGRVLAHVPLLALAQAQGAPLGWRSGTVVSNQRDGLTHKTGDDQPVPTLGGLNAPLRCATAWP